MRYDDREQFDERNIFGTGEPNTAYARYFVGNSFLNPLTDPGCGLFAANVTFEPGCRNNWHIHRASRGGGQILICTAGEGWYQEEGEEAVPLKEGSVVTVPPNVKHWHGARRDSWFSHIAVEVPGEGCSNEWCEPVSDGEYDRLRNREPLIAGKEFRRAGASEPAGRNPVPRRRSLFWPRPGTRRPCPS